MQLDGDTLTPQKKTNQKDILSNPYYVDARKLSLRDKATLKDETVYTQFIIPVKKLQDKDKLNIVQDTNQTTTNTDDTQLVIQSQEDNSSTNTTNDLVTIKTQNDDNVSNSVDNTNTDTLNQEQVTNLPITNKSNKYFVGASIYLDSIDVNKEVVSGTNLNLPSNDDSTISFNIHVGAKKLYNNFQAVINYDYIPLDDVKLQNYYLSINYQWDDIHLNPYLGVLTGMSKLQWKIDPLTNYTTKDNTSVASGFVGLQGGIEYYLKDNYSIISQAIYQEYFHTTEVIQTSNQTNIHHDRRFGVGIGLRYGF